MMIKKNDRPRKYDDIAVIGISLRFPMCDNMDEYWEIILKGKECIRNVPHRRKQDINDILKALGEHERTYVKGGFLDRIDEFDYEYYSISPTEASVMNPLQRLFLQVVTEAIDDSGYGYPCINGTNTGVFVGYQSSELVYSAMISKLCPDLKDISFAGNEISIVASRPAYYYNWKGPVIVIDNACASSISAIHMGCRSLQSRECDVAVVGGIALNMLPFEKGYTIGVESTDYKTRAFDDNSNGTVGGEGIGVVILKPLAKALCDGDDVYAVIKGSAINSNGKTLGITMPNVEAQEEVIVSAWKNADINPEELVYIETHGTGTRIGDPTEVLALKRAFERYTEDKQFCAIGSVKSNIGHLLGAAGIAGFIKAVLILNKKQIPKTINLEMPNRKISFCNGPVYPNDIVKKLSSTKHSYCGISAFGINGTNGHVVISGPITLERTIVPSYEDIIVLSANSEQQMLRLLFNYVRYIRKTPSLIFNDMCYTNNISRRLFKYKVAIIAKDIKDLLNKIELIINNDFDVYMENTIYTFKNETYRFHDNVKDVEQCIRTKRKNGKSALYELSKLAMAYMCNVSINWSVIYDSRYVRRIHLPPYPLNKLRCWPKFEQQYSNNIIDTKSNVGTNYYIYRWEKETTLPCSSQTKSQRTFLVYDNEFGDELNRLLKRCICDTKIINIRKDNRINYVDLFCDIIHDFSPQRIIVNFGASNFTYDDINIYEREETVVGLLIDLFSAIKKEGDYNISSVIFVTHNVCYVDHNDRCINSEDSIIHNVTKALRWELPAVQFLIYDIDDKTEVGHIIHYIDADLHDARFLVAYRDNERYFPVIDIANKNKLDCKPHIKINGIYLIVGGLSEIGLHIAKRISNICRTTIILAGRKMDKFETWIDTKLISDADRLEKWSRSLEIIDYIKSKGSSVVLEVCDVSSIEDVNALQGRLEQRNMHIDGIFHCAAEKGGCLIHQATRAHFSTIIASKYYGAYNLYSVFSKKNLDFIIFNASAMTAIGEPGASMYLAANGYLDSIVHRFIQAGCKAYSIDWPAWENTGISKGQIIDENKELFGILSPATAVSSLFEVFDYPPGQIVIGRININSDLFLLQKYMPFKMSEQILNNRLRDDSVDDMYVFQNIEHHDIKTIITAIVSTVLGYKKIDNDINFYDMGLDSIIAVKIINRINAALYIQLKLSDLLSNLTVNNLVECIETKYINYSSINKDIHDKYIVNKAPQMEYYPVSSAQYRMYILNQIKNDTTYNLSEAIEIDGELDVSRICDALDTLIKRHDILRTSHVLIGDNIYQQIHSQVNLEFSHKKYDLFDRDIVEKEFVTFVRPFHLDKPPLFRVLLLTFLNMKSVLMFDMHHIISDGKSHSILIEEFVALYHGVLLPKINLQYKDYAVWQNDFCNGDLMRKQREFWISRYSRYPLIQLPYDYDRPDKHLNRGGAQTFYIHRPLYDSVYEISKKYNVTIFNVLLSWYIILLWFCTEQKRIIIGTVIEGRFNEELERMIGMFTNTLALDFTVDAELKYADYLDGINKECMSFFDNQDYPFEDLVEELRVTRHVNRNPLFDVMFVLQQRQDAKVDINNLKIRPFEKKVVNAKFDLTLDISDTGTQFAMTMFYMKDLFAIHTIDYFCRLYLRICELICKDELITLNRIKNILSEMKRDDYYNTFTQSFNID